MISSSYFYSFFVIMYASDKKGLEKLLGMRVVGVKNLEEALDQLF